MVEILEALNPRFESAGTILFNEFESYGEIIFVEKGEVGLGFEINKQLYLAMKYKDKAVLGAYNVTFNQEGSIVYKALSNITG